MKRKSSIIIIILFLVILSAKAQGFDSKSLSLSECITIALDNNISYRQSIIQREAADVNYRQTRSRLLPNINADFNYGTNTGRSIDPFTNSYIDQQLNFTNVGLNLGNQIFNGFEILNSIQRDKFNLSAAKAEEEQARQRLILDVAIAYYQVLNNKDLLELARLRYQSTDEQARRLKSLYEEGEGNPADYTDIVGQLKNDETVITETKSRLEQAKLELKQLLNVEYDIELDYENRETGLGQFTQSAQQVYENALKDMPSIEAREFRVHAAEENIAVARSLYVPRVDFFAQVNSNYSSLANLFNETGSEVVETAGFVTVDGTDYSVFRNEQQFTQESIPFLDQLNNNLNTVIGISVDIPIFNGFRARQNIQLRKLEFQDSQLELENAKNDLETEVRTAHNLMTAAYENYNLFQEQVLAYEDSFSVNEVRFNNGVSNYVEYIISKNNLDRARINLRNSYYEWLIRRKILEFYMGQIY
ncbi:TolC family protein [Gramella sp. KN1008]|uniref:TolC family protein n=1 Tax=Gramella sp. KN1008 TaxID=2529298 RepID=UPI0010392C6C|nr:TolC family protein [Gramella sp. KN1008]TBW25902.1 TolC family protein [Gramella sp. KN1008]